MADNGNEQSNGNGQNTGRVESVTGVVVDAVFDDHLPEIYSALEIQMSAGGEERDADEATTLVCEVQ
jgi:F0F1-type ATP synthase beta subunit